VTFDPPLQHPLLHRIYEIRYLEGKVVIVQPLVEQGSLRDYLHNVESPVQEWAYKYDTKGKRRMKREEIAQCGKSIIEAVLFLYSLGFPPIVHIQSANIFRTAEGGYRLGGYENTLLGYKSRYHHLCVGYGDTVDIIMLGKWVMRVGGGWVCGWVTHYALCEPLCCIMLWVDSVGEWVGHYAEWVGGSAGWIGGPVCVGRWVTMLGGWAIMLGRWVIMLGGWVGH
jgi:hypothetical protein